MPRTDTETPLMTEAVPAEVVERLAKYRVSVMNLLIEGRDIYLKEQPDPGPKRSWLREMFTKGRRAA